MKISIIVPVYNVEVYLERCLDSIVNQIFDNYEVIMVNDGSTDNSGEICESYARRYSNFYAFSKENGGLSDARNYGLKRCNGDYILFVDSDDFVNENTLSYFQGVIEKINREIDIIVGRSVTVREGMSFSFENSYLLETPDVMTGEEFLKIKLGENKYQVAVWTKLYRREFLETNNLFFYKGLIHEDELFTPLTFLKARSVVDIDFIFYAYYVRSNSIMTSKNQLKNANAIYTIIHKLIPVYDAIQDNILKKAMENHSATIYYQALSRISYKEAKENKLIDYPFAKKSSHTTLNKVRAFSMRFNYQLLKKLTR